MPRRNRSCWTKADVSFEKQRRFLDAEVEDEVDAEQAEEQESIASSPSSAGSEETTIRQGRPLSASTSHHYPGGLAAPSTPHPLQWKGQRTARWFLSDPQLCLPVSDVTSWLDAIGFQQYRKKFIHHSIDGALLLQLTDSQLKLDVGIGPLGHRHGILKAIANLRTVCRYPASDRPQSAPTRSTQHHVSALSNIGSPLPNLSGGGIVDRHALCAGGRIVFL